MKAIATARVCTSTVLCALVATVAATSASAAAERPPGANDRPLEELDEVLVRGKRLIERIIDAEDEFYLLYNDLNKDDDYDFSCVNLKVDPVVYGSTLQSRICIPGFMAGAMADWGQWQVRCLPDIRYFDENQDETITWPEWREAVMNPLYYMDFQDADTDRNNRLTRFEFEAWAAGIAQNPRDCGHPPPQLVLADRNDDLQAHMLQTVNSDPRLQKMAGGLDDLYRELTAEWLAREERLRLEREARPKKVINPDAGPR